jgi:hypothetical protein
MKTFVHFLSYLAHFFLQLKMFQTNLMKKDEIFCVQLFFGGGKEVDGLLVIILQF